MFKMQVLFKGWTNKRGLTLKIKNQDKIGIFKTYLINVTLPTYILGLKPSLPIHVLTSYWLQFKQSQITN
jgi:hypothetical protein